MDDNQKNSLFEEFGGDKSVSEIIDGFYYQVLTDKNLRRFYLKADMSQIRYQQKRYFSQMLGSDQIYQGRDLHEVHKNLNVTDTEFDKFKFHLLNKLKDKEKPEHIIKYIIDKVEEQRSLIVIAPEEKK